MNIYYSGGSDTPEKLMGQEARVMLSFHKMPKARFGRLDDPRNQLFLDSGAFSLWGNPSEWWSSEDFTKYVRDYSKFLKKNPEIVNYAVIDKIGDPDITLRNQQLMEEMELDPVPVIHLGDDIQFLRRHYESYDHIALGGLVGSKRSSGSAEMWLCSIWNEILRIRKTQTLRVHGFGVTNFRWMKKFPWTSVDSTTWAKDAGFGIIHVPKTIGNSRDFGEPSNRVNIGSRTSDAKHFKSMSKNTQEYIMGWIESKGFSLKDMDEYENRASLNVHYFREVEKSSTHWTFPKQYSLNRGIVF